MRLRPVMRSSHECEKVDEDLECRLSHRMRDRETRAVGVPWPDEQDREHVEKRSLEFGFGLGNSNRRCQPFQQNKGMFQLRRIWDGSAQQCNRLFDALRAHASVAGWPAFANKKPKVTNDAVADIAELGAVRTLPY